MKLVIGLVPIAPIESDTLIDQRLSVSTDSIIMGLPEFPFSCGIAGGLIGGIGRQ